MCGHESLRKANEVKTITEGRKTQISNRKLKRRNKE